MERPLKEQIYNSMRYSLRDLYFPLHTQYMLHVSIYNAVDFELFELRRHVVWNIYSPSVEGA